MIPPPTPFTAEQLLAAGVVYDRGQLTDGQRIGLTTLVMCGLVLCHVENHVLVWRPVVDAWGKAA